MGLVLGAGGHGPTNEKLEGAYFVPLNIQVIRYIFIPLSKIIKYTLILTDPPPKKNPLPIMGVSKWFSFGFTRVTIKGESKGR